MSRIAIDVVLLPEETMSDRVIELNRKLVETYGEAIVLNRKTCLPHVSLAMGCIESGAIDAVRERLRSIASEMSLGQLKAVGVRTSTNSRGEQVSAIEIDRTRPLQKLHEEVMRQLEPFFGREVTAAMIHDEVAAETALEWIRDYRQRSSFERFWPHITIGYGQLQHDLSYSCDFQASALALCHLGNHCTCRRVLTSVDIR